MGWLAYVCGFFQAGRHTDDIADIIAAIGVHRTLTMVFTGTGCVLFVGAAIFYNVLGLGDARDAVAFVAVGLVALTVLRGIPYWKRITAYTKLGPTARRG